MPPVQLRFYEKLNDFLPPERRKVGSAHALTRRTAVRHLIESFGVPHTEVGVVLANGQPVDSPISSGRMTCERFRRCQACAQAYCRGRGFKRMAKLCEYFARPA